MTELPIIPKDENGDMIFDYSQMLHQYEYWEESNKERRIE